MEKENYSGSIKYIDGGVTAAEGFTAAGIHCGIRKNKDKKDLALILSDTIGDAAAVYTTNLVKGAPLRVTAKHLQNGKAQAVICNSGNANTCNANGEEVAEKTALLVEKYTSVKAEDVIVASTGVIGVPLDIRPIEEGIEELAEKLGKNSTEANLAIMTTDTVTKQVAVQFRLDGKVCTLGGIAKGSGMICPNMATMLVFLTTDVNISSEALQSVINEDVQNSFNMVSVDGDTSTNDMLVIIANGKAGNGRITGLCEDYDMFKCALKAVTVKLCKMIAADGEGSTKLLECSVEGAKDKATAKTIAKSVVKSSLLKAAMFGADANWGRVLCAIGYSGADADVNKIDVAFSSKTGRIEVCRNGAGLNFSEKEAKKILSEKEIRIEVQLNDGAYSADAWGCDLTYDYVKINGDYRT